MWQLAQGREAMVRKDPCRRRRVQVVQVLESQICREELLNFDP